MPACLAWLPAAGLPGWLAVVPRSGQCFVSLRALWFYMLCGAGRTRAYWSAEIAVHCMPCHQLQAAPRPPLPQHELQQPLEVLLSEAVAGSSHDACGAEGQDCRFADPPAGVSTWQGCGEAPAWLQPLAALRCWLPLLPLAAPAASGCPPNAGLATA